MGTTRAALSEWRRAWPVPLSGMLGIAGCSIWTFSQGVLMEPVTNELGLTRAEFSSAFLLQNIVALIAFPLGGRLIDRFGPRRIALAGVPLAVLGFFLFGLASGPFWQWLLLASLQTFCNALVVFPLWVTAVVGRFDSSRGTALAVTISGVGVAMALWPLLAALLVDVAGWRLSLGLLAIGWAIVLLPLIWFGFFGRADLDRLGRGEAAPRVGLLPIEGAPTRLGMAAIARSPEFLLVTAAGFLFASVSIGLTVNLVPILTAREFGLGEAAGIAGIAGIFSIIGRLGTGILLDTLPVRPLAISVFLMPMLVAFLLLGAGNDYGTLLFAVALLGLSGGSETDIVTFIASRQFDRRIFASLYGLMTAFFAIGASIGPLVASALFDRSGSYNDYLYVVIGFIAASTLLIAIATGRPEQAEGH